MPTLTEIEMRVLSELEEAGAENLPTIANTVGDGRGPQEREPLRAALDSLVRMDFVRIAILDDDLTAELSASVIGKLHEHLKYDAPRKCWTGGLRPWPEVTITEAGKQVAFEILDDRGYQWWRTDR